MRSITRHTTRGKIFNGEKSTGDRSASEFKRRQVNIDEQYQISEGINRVVDRVFTSGT